MDCIDQDVYVDYAGERQTALQDAAHISTASGGSPDAFADLQRIYSRRLFSTIFKITRNREDAEDVLQETFLRAYLSLRHFEGRSSLYSWLTRIAINSALMLLRKRRNHPEEHFDLNGQAENDFAHLEPKDPCLNPEQICDQRQRCANIHRAIERLHSSLREPLQSRMTHGSSLGEIAKALDLTEAAVKARLYRARRRLSTTRPLKENRGTASHLMAFTAESAGFQNREQPCVNSGRPV
jgi:RNA polymerase sigma-70 factor, ECF subfamily